MPTFELVLVLLVLVVAGLVVGTRFRVLAMASLMLATSGCAFLEALAIGASSGRAALRVAEAGVVFEDANAFGAVLVQGRLPFLRRGRGSEAGSPFPQLSFRMLT